MRPYNNILFLSSPSHQHFVVQTMLVTWGNKKQNVVARFSAKAEFRAMAQGVCELLWLKIILHDIKMACEEPMILY